MENTKSYELTEDQAIAVGEITKFLAHPTDQIFTLSGLAGAGKTFCIKAALENRKNVYAATVSHSAKNVLADSFKEANVNVACYTLAKLLGLKMYIDEDGEVTFRPDPYKDKVLPIEMADILVIDECSMISQEHHFMILNLKKKHCKLIYMGENCPV